MYNHDVGTARLDYIRLKEFTDIERRVHTAITEAFQEKVAGLKLKLRAVSNILRTPRLTAIFHKEMTLNMKSF